jgi:hypothetical protein
MGIKRNFLNKKIKSKKVNEIKIRYINETLIKNFRLLSFFESLK